LPAVLILLTMGVMATLSSDFNDLLPAGASAPDFTLTDVVTGNQRSLGDLAGPKGTLVVFLCAHCPYVVHVRGKVAELALEFFPEGISTVGISANDPVAYPDDAPEKLREMVLETDLPFPVLFDATQETARAYTAACTPDFFLFDADRRLAYRGRLDESSPKNGKPLTGNDLHAALEAVAEGKSPATPWPPALGCSIKWKA
jgi:peroxiredoxin